MQRAEFTKAGTQDASRVRVAVVVARFNEDITEELLRGALSTLARWRVKDKNVSVIRVPGSFEIPYGCTLALKKRPDAIIAIGCIIKGETEHDRYIAHAVAQGITHLSLSKGVPVALGVITPNTLKQARARAFGSNHGAKAAAAALEMALLKKKR